MPKQEMDGVELFNLALSIVGTVLRDGDQKVSELGELFEVSEAAVKKAVLAVANSEDLKNYETHFYVDLEELEDGYVSISQGMSPLGEPPALSKRQLSSIAIGLDYLAAIPQFAADAELQALRTLIRESSPAAVTNQTPTRLSEQIEKLQQALGRQLAVSCEYINQTGVKSSRTIDPLRIDFIGRRHYLRGYCRTSKELRAFRLDRIQSIELTDSEIPESTKALKIPEDVFGESAQEQLVEISASAEAAEVFWNFPVASEPRQVGDEVRGTIRVGNLAALGRHVAKYGGMVKVIAPESARAAVRDFANRAISGAATPGDEE